MRIGFAFLYLCDRFLWTLDIESLLSPSVGSIPYSVGQDIMEHDKFRQWSLLALAPESDAWLWTVHGLGIFHGILLLLGVFPRTQVLAIFVNINSFHNATTLVHERQDVMFRIFCFLLFFLPLGRYSLLGDNKNNTTTNKNTKTSSWPMWPFRLWQLQICFIYQGASFGKLFSRTWLHGNAMWRITHMNDFYGGVFNPDFIFNRLGPLKFMCWSALVVETLCYITIWPKRTRLFTLAVVVALHVGIELSMNMHCFEWLSLLGWMPFLVTPDDAAAAPATTTPESSSSSENKNKKKNHTNNTNKSYYRWVVNAGILSLLVANTTQCNVMTYVEESSPAVLKPIFSQYNAASEYLRDNYVHPFTFPLGLYQYAWDLYKGDVNTSHKSYILTLTFENGGEPLTYQSPDWYDTPWYIKKRNQRPMDYIEHLAYPEHNGAAYKRLCENFAKMHGGGDGNVVIAQVQLEYTWRWGALEPPSDLNWWTDPAQASFENDRLERKILYTIQFPQDDGGGEQSGRSQPEVQQSVEHNDSSSCELDSDKA